MSSLLDRLHAAAKPYLTGWRYGHTNRVAYPWPKGIKGPAVAAVAADREIDCSTLSASLLMRLFPDAKWKQEHYEALQVFHPVSPDSPRWAAVVATGAVAVDDFAAESLHLVQGWRSLTPLSGHAILVYDRGTGVLDVLESTSREGNRGPRWRSTTEAKLRAEFAAALYIARLVEAP